MLSSTVTVNLPKTRKTLSLDPLIEVVHQRAESLPDWRKGSVTYSMADAVMSAMAMFSLKDEALLRFEERRNDENLKQIYRIGAVPSDTRMREILDPLSPDSIRPMFNDVFAQLQRGGALRPYRFQGHYLLSVDGTGYFASKNVNCQSCLEKKNKKTGEVTFHHQMLGAAMVHPDQKQVIPFAPDPIVKQDGENKNDCERNAAKRLLTKIRDEHPHLKLIIVEDALASNAPHIRLLKKLRMHFILGAKPDAHQHLFDEVIRAGDEERFESLRFQHPTHPDISCEISFVNDLPLNKSNADVRVNFMQYIEYDPDGGERLRFSWVTDLPITHANAFELVRGARSRWRIENETFNTLKNQGYQFEHNFGHGNINLSVVFAMLMMLTFLVDQAQELCCPLFQAVRKKWSSRRAVWDHIRSHFRHFLFDSMEQLYQVILTDAAKELPISILFSKPPSI